MKTAGQGVSQGTLEDWLNGRPSWLRAAATGLINDRRLPNETELTALVDHCVAEVAGTLNSPHAPLPPGAILGAATGSDLRIERISGVRGVNAIGHQATLVLTGADLTVIYGANGSGKSGYARLMKHLCGARARGSMHGNVFEPKPDAASAVVSLSSQSVGDGSPTKSIDLNWKASDGPLSKLSAVPVFDAATAAELAESANSATHLPRTMRFVGALITVADSVSLHIKRRSELLVSGLPTLPADLAITTASTFLGNLTHALTQVAIDARCTFSEEMRLERVAIETALTQANPSDAHAKCVGEIDRLTQLGQTTSQWAGGFGDDKAKEIVEARSQALGKRSAATAYATAFFQGLPLIGVGEELWRKMWAAAGSYARERAYPDHDHPNTTDGGRCVLCQQVLDGESRARMESFAGFVGNQLQSEAEAAETILTKLMDCLPVAKDEAHWDALAGISGLAKTNATLLNEQITKRLEALRTATTFDALPIVAWDAWESASAKKASELATQRDDLAALLDPAGRQLKETRLQELRGCEWLTTQRLSVIAEVDRLKQQNHLAAAARLAGTAALTNKSNEIADAELSKGFCDRFNAEIQKLGGKYVPVSMTPKTEGKGKFTFQIGLRNSKKVVRNHEVLSEGEQRIVSLAAFLADATGSDRSLPVILDDPISSLDQQYEESVAERLVELAATRQVVVFTHRLSLMVLIGNAAGKRAELALSPVAVEVVSIARDGESTGMPSTIDAFSLKPQKGLNQLISTIGAAKKLDAAVRKLAIKDACSNFRILVERAVEDHLCSGIINRYRREMKTLNMLHRLTAIEPKDCSLINQMMTKYSAFEHSQSIETPTWLPTPEELLSDVSTMLEWCADFDRRAKAAVAKV